MIAAVDATGGRPSRLTYSDAARHRV